MAVKGGYPGYGPLWDPSRTLYTPWTRPVQVNGPFVYPFRPLIYHPILRFRTGIHGFEMWIPGSHRSIDRFQGQTLRFRPFEGLNLESLWHPSDAVVGLDPFRDCGDLR